MTTTRKAHHQPETIDPILTLLRNSNAWDRFTGFLDALDATPDCNATRLAMADWFAEQGDGSRAEYVRVRLELERIPPRPEHYPNHDPTCESHAKWGVCSCGVLQWHRYSDRHESLSARRATLLADNPHWTAWPCPGCDGISYVPPVCPMCRNTGDLASQWTTQDEPSPYGVTESRIDPARDFYGRGAVPIVCDVGCRLDEVLERCRECADSSEPGWIHRHGDNGPGYYACRGCTDIDNGETRGTGFVPTSWALQVRELPWVRGFRVTDREPYWNGGGYCWFDVNREQASGAVPSAAQLPTFVFQALMPFPESKGRLRWRGYPTPELARRSLSRALMELVRGATP